MSKLNFDKVPAYGQVSDFMRLCFDKCYRIERQLSLYVDNELSAKSRAFIEAHIGECPSCLKALTVLQAAHVVLSQREEILPPTYLRERLRQAIAIEATRPVATAAPRNVFNGRLILAGATCVAVLVAAVVAQINPQKHADVGPSKPTVHLMPLQLNKPSSKLVASLPQAERHPYVRRTAEHTYVASNDSSREPKPNDSSLSFPMPEPERIATPIISEDDTSRALKHRTSQSETMIAKNGSSESYSPRTNRQAVIAEKLPQPAPAITAPLSAPENSTITSAPPAPEVQTASNDMGDDSYHMSLVDQMRSMALRTQDEQPKLLRLAVQYVPLPKGTGTEQIVGDAIH
jgi:hypothetical protein